VVHRVVDRGALDPLTDEERQVAVYGDDIYTEPEPDSDTLANLGPLRAIAGVWEGTGNDEHPAAFGIERNTFFEHYELEPIDAQTNGPQLFYGLRYHTHIVKPGEVETFHDQVGYWLWEPAANAVTLTLGIPRGQVLLASGAADATATDFELTATVGSETYGILSNPFLDQSFRTVSYRIHVTSTAMARGRTRRKDSCRSRATTTCSITPIATLSPSSPHRHRIRWRAPPEATVIVEPD
jgi:hypothetical protein